MSLELITGLGFGLTLLGIGFVTLDAFMARFVRRNKRQGLHDLSDQEMLISIRKPIERRRIKHCNLSYEAAVTHRMRRGGLVVVALGLAILVCVGAFRMIVE